MSPTYEEDYEAGFEHGWRDAGDRPLLGVNRTSWSWHYGYGYEAGKAAWVAEHDGGHGA